MSWKDGKVYPVYKVEVSSESHPFYTGQKSNFNNYGKVEKFNKKYNI
jgi:large subunit ribosomal protein L31